MVRRSLWSSGIVCVVLAASPRASEAQSRVPRVTVGPFTGERAAVTRSIVSGVLANHVGEIELRSQNEYTSTATRLGAGDRVDEATVSTVARALGVDEVVVGSLERSGTGYRLRLRVLRGGDGRGAASASWEFERIEEINAFANEIWEQLRGAFRVDTTITAPAPPDRETPTEHSPPVETPTEHASSGGVAAAPEATTPGLGWLWIQVGGGLAGRRWRIPVLGETTPRGYENGAFGELRATLAAYYRVNHNRLGVGVESTVGFPLGLSSQGRGPDGRVVPIATSALEFQFGAAMAVRPTSGGMFRLFVGMVYHQFSLDTSRLSAEMRLAPVTYVGLRVAGEGTLPLYASPSWEFGLIFGGELRLAATGSEVKEAFGTNPDTTLGFGTWFGLGLRLDRAAPGLAVRATAEFTRYATDFAGPARIGTPGGSLDDYTRFLVGVVYALGTERTVHRPPSNPYDSAAAPPPDEPAVTGNSGGSQPSGDPFGGR
jgi:hypothetical protein